MRCAECGSAFEQGDPGCRDGLEHIPQPEPDEREFTIPVAFSVFGVNEQDAALRLVRILTKVGVIGHSHGGITCWWTPNQPTADGSDRAERLEFLPELTIDECEAVGVDGTGRDGDPRYPYTIANLELHQVELLCLHREDALRRPRA